MQKLTKSTADTSNINHAFYNYTSGRWLYNEPLRMLERKLSFNRDALCHAIAKSVDLSAEDIVHFTKIAEGGSFRIFEATFRTDLKVIARLPYPSTLPRKHGVDSEVATMEFLRLQGLPIPRIYDWASSTSNPVGVEYIIMERVEGKELADSWYTMELKERMTVMEKIVDVERKLFNIRFPASGSIYFKNFPESSVRTVSIPATDHLVQADRFCLGRSTEHLWWYQSRNKLGVNPGPWERTEDLLRAVGERESEWLRRFGKMRYPREPLYRELYGRQMVTPQTQLNSLRNYLSTVPYLAPVQAELNLPTIRHPDFSPSNIFINDSGEITGIIDWQHTTVLPLFLQAKIPKHFQNYGDDDSENFRPPKLASNFATLSEMDKESAMELYRRRQVHYFYVGFTNRMNRMHFNAIGKHNIILRNRLYDTAGRPWEGDSTSLQAELIRILALWPEIGQGSSQPPFQYEETDIEHCLDRDGKQREADTQMQQLRDFIGINIEGWIPTESFLDAVEKAEILKKEMIDAAETAEEKREIDTFWPFQDHEEID